MAIYKLIANGSFGPQEIEVALAASLAWANTTSKWT